MKNIFATIGLSLFLLQSCATQNNQTLNLDLGGSWELNYINETSGTTIGDGFPNKKPTLVLESISKKLTGNSGCNQMFGSFTTQQNSISFSGLGATKMYCEGVKENEYFRTLESTKTYKIVDGKLNFYNEKDELILSYSKKD